MTIDKKLQVTIRLKKSLLIKLRRMDNYNAWLEKTLKQILTKNLKEGIDKRSLFLYNIIETSGRTSGRTIKGGFINMSIFKADLFITKIEGKNCKGK